MSARETEFITREKKTRYIGVMSSYNTILWKPKIKRQKGKINVNE